MVAGTWNGNSMRNGLGMVVISLIKQQTTYLYTR